MRFPTISSALSSMPSKSLPGLAYAFLALLIIIPLLGPGYYLTLDMQFGPGSFEPFQFHELYGTGPSQYGAYLPVKLAMAALSLLLPVEVVEKLLLFTIVFLCGALMHHSLPKNLGSSRYFAGLLYMLNPFVFVRFLAGHWSLLLSYAVWPVALRSFMDFLERPKDAGNLFRASLLTSAAAVSSHGLLMLLLAYLAVFIVHMARLAWKAATSASLKQPRAPLVTAISDSALIPLVSRTILLALIVIVLNLYWLAPTAILTSGMYSPSSPEASLAQFGSQGIGMPLWQSVLTMHGFWREGFTLTKDVFSLWYVPFILIIAVVLAGLISLFSSDRGSAVSMLLIGAAGFLLALGASSPAVSFFTLFGDAIPLSLFFRDTQKFVGLLCLAYSWLGAYGADAVLSTSSKASKTAARFIKPALLALLLAIPVIYDYGFFGLLGQTHPTSYPDDWYKAGQIIASDPVEGYVVVFPAHLYYYYPWVKSSQKILGNPAEQFFSKPVLSPSSVETPYVQSDVNDSRERYMTYLFDNRQYINETATMLLPLNARYIIVLTNDPDYVHYLYMLDRKGGVPGIEKVYQGKMLYLFRNDLVMGPFFASAENGSGGLDVILENSGNGVYSGNVSFEKTGPVSYDILSSPLEYVVFAPRMGLAFTLESGNFSEWHGMAMKWRFGGKASLSNWLFPIILGLFMLSWLLACCMLLRFSKGPCLAVAGASIIIVVAVLYGYAGPAMLGLFILLSLALVAIAGMK
jgi:hypothetical protein